MRILGSVQLVVSLICVHDTVTFPQNSARLLPPSRCPFDSRPNS